MKTPRELLLEKHQEIDPKLDALRQEFVSSLAASSGRRTVIRRAPAPEAFGWLRALLSKKWQIAALTATWLVIAVLRLSAGADPISQLSHAKPPSSQVLIVTLKENRRQIAELAGAPATPTSPIVPARQSRRSCLEVQWAYS